MKAIAVCPYPFKQGHPTRRGAQRNAQNVQRRGGGAVEAYLCKCGLWHIGGKSKGRAA